MGTSHDRVQAQDSIHIARDPDNTMIQGFEIHLGTEDVSAFMPFSSIKDQMPDQDKRLLESDARSFLRKYGQVMINTARQRMREGQLGTPEDLERFEATEKMKADLEDLGAEEAEILAQLRTTSGGAEA